MRQATVATNCFAAYDKDQSGAVSMKELKHMLQQLVKETQSAPRGGVLPHCTKFSAEAGLRQREVSGSA